MRKMNKIVALSLVLAMALSMMASAASFKDQATINEDLVDEINMMVALNIYSENGTGAGNFEPNMTISRAQAAKMIYVLKNKGNDNGATSWTGMNIFTDVEAGSWYEGYVNYCASTGILAGTGDNQYNPNGQLTGVELAKLLLVVNGYKADVQGYTGDKWAENILADAEAAGLFEGYELPVKGVVTREWAAKLFVNGITEVAMVKYEDGELVEQYGSTSTIDLETGKITTTTAALTYAGHVLALNEAEGVLMATPRIELVANGKNPAVGDEDNNTSKVEDVAFEYDASDDLLGQFVTVLYKGESLAKADKVYGVTAHEDVSVLKTTVAAVDTDDVDFEDDFKIYRDFEKQTYNAALWGTKDNRVVTLIDNDDDGDYNIGLIESVAYDKVEYINAKNGIFRVVNDRCADIDDEDDFEAINFVDEVEKGDIVKITYDFSTGEKVMVIELVESVTGVVSKKSGSTYTIDGEGYKIIKDSMAIGTPNVNVSSEEQVFYVDGGYIVCTTNVAENEFVEKNILFVIAKTASSTTDEWGKPVHKLEVILNDGTQGIYDYDVEIDDNAKQYSAISTKKIYEYVIDGDEICVIDLEDEEIGTLEETDLFDKSASRFKTDSKNYIVNDETYFFVVDGDDYAVVKADEIADDMYALDGAKFAANVDGLPYLYFAVLEGEIPGAESTEVDYAILAGSETQELDENNKKVYKVVATALDGTETTLVSKNSFEDELGMFVSFDVNSDGYASVTLIKDSTFKWAALTEVEGSMVMLKSNGDDEAKLFDLADDVDIYFVDYNADDDEVTVEEGDELVFSAETEENTLEESVLYIYDSADKEITMIICEISGEEIPAKFFDIAE